MKPEVGETLLALMQRHGIGYLDYAGPDGRLRIDADLPDPHPPIFADRPGQYLSRHPAEAGPTIWPRRVLPGDVVGWLKVGPILHPVEAWREAMLYGPRLAEGQLAGYGTQLF
jgi:hypothetical protein